ncbi:MAG: ABC transporter permease [Staphylococcus equorum]|uniref:ABC transporter permease n=1 Tax=Staphylococcus TaxID=1279 RepID=UPI0008538528|nr:ABC transporter permease [Staphylococcus equorum]MDG0823370.1 ABC transporter permease [Staphylococcus equorum]MDG0836808.1 ABC transporter permease [Staphylococcus equorum]MDK9871400.1 ABC transporter permease [Staphylococcus equorum]MDK9877555.1 ABC transporter permease [Staphylococcus equorum]MDN5829211.1 ABC transporter permease [Staphylococcus equorum]
MIQPYLFIVVVKQWKQYVLLALLLLCALLAVWGLYKTLNQSFQIPVAVQDQERSSASESLIEAIDGNEFVQVEHVPLEEAYIEERVTRKEAVVSLQIPENYSDKLHSNHLKDALTLYGRDDFIGDITLEMISRSLYEQQIPNIVKSHLEDNDQDTSLKAVNRKLNQETPESKIAHYVINHSSNTSISLSVVFAILLCVSSVQIVLHQRLKQNGALARLFMFRYSRLKLFGTYAIAHTMILMILLSVTAVVFQQSLSLMFYVKSLWVILIYELGVAWLLFKVNTLSHRLFMTLIYALVMGLIYIFIQL